MSDLLKNTETLRTHYGNKYSVCAANGQKLSHGNIRDTLRTHLETMMETL